MVTSDAGYSNKTNNSKQLIYVALTFKQLCQEKLSRYSDRLKATHQGFDYQQA
jgi:hypothetical protein